MQPGLHPGDKFAQRVPPSLVCKGGLSVRWVARVLQRAGGNAREGACVLVPGVVVSQHMATSVAELQVAVLCLALVGRAALTNNNPGGVGSSQRL